MDEMTNMNETTVMENDTSVEVVPEENVQVIENEETSGVNPMAVLGVVLGVGTVMVGGIKYLKNKKNQPKEDKPKTKKKIHLRAPWTVEEVVTEEKVEDGEIVEGTSDEEA